jgi:pimeloyl-ACP methyl ester carboxylesterase
VATERDVKVGDRVLRIRDGGDETGWPVIYLHGTPGSRLDLALHDATAAECGVRLVSFDRPGYGGSTPSPFGLRAVGEQVHTIADSLGLGRFSTLGFSGGGPFALAAAAGNDRVAVVGVADGAGPFEEVAGALDELDENDRLAYALLSTDRHAAAAQFSRGFGPVLEAARKGPDGLLTFFGPALSDSDAAIFELPEAAAAFAASVEEALGSSLDGAGWDNVAWIGAWDINLAEVGCEVILWYGSEDRFAAVSHGEWQAKHLANAKLIVRPGEGHFGHLVHLAEILTALIPSEA